MIRLTTRQAALLRLPDPGAFIPKLAAEIRRDHPQSVAGLSDEQLLADTEACSHWSSETLAITHLPVLVDWVKADVAWARRMSSWSVTRPFVEKAANPNLGAADFLSLLRAGTRRT